MEITAGIHLIKTPLKNSSLVALNAYLLQSDEGDLLIDSGWNDEAAYRALLQGLEEAGSSPQNLRLLFFTHTHPDHVGLAARLKEKCGAPVLYHELEGRLVPAYGDREKLLVEEQCWLQSNGMPREKIDYLYNQFFAQDEKMLPPRADRFVQDGERIQWGEFDLQVIHTPGHAAGHVCLYESKKQLLFSGDHVLQHISPNVGLHNTEGGNPLGDYYASLERVRGLPVTQVLPAHGNVFTDLQGRVDELKAHHEERLLEIKSVIDGNPLMAYEVASGMHWLAPGTKWENMHPFQQYLALVETIAHLKLLQVRGELQMSSHGENITYR